ncbi:hypothetical protein EXIGLDRAFT_761064 [Exidia glandulosa HHB12029]|uniref:F-box domain-containing protein n=1 Tax=Exidia glandulosa HHB12029 TaxID=1314781 RepID=A0A166BH85_EXIGL|nr:hypothetical protein EXIGLDRAFT_761064 [Exidia glandulosa HHB12029]
MSLPKRQSQRLLPFRGLNDLPIELVERILDLVDWPYGFRSLTLVSKALNEYATPRLYAILPVAWAQPERTCALLEFLQRDVHRANMVRTIVCDKDLDCLGYISGVELSFVNSNLPFADVHLERLARLLCEELPLLRSVRHVVIRRIHPKLLHTGVQIRYAPRGSRISRLALFWRKDSRSYYSYFSPSGDFWSAMNVSVPRIESLEAPLHSYSKPSPWTLRHLTFLSLLGKGNPSFRLPDTWNRTLAESSKLQTLELHTCRGEDLVKFGLFKLRLPSLATLICHRVIFDEHEQCDVFFAFLFRHADCLEILCLHLSIRLDVHISHTALRCLSFWSGTFQRLRVLRIYNLPDNSCDRCGVDPTVHRQRCAPHTHDPLAVERIAAFIQQRPNITDVAFTGLDDDSRGAILSATNDRIMLRVLLVGGQPQVVSTGDVGAPPAKDGLVLDPWIWNVFLTHGFGASYGRPQTFNISR